VQNESLPQAHYLLMQVPGRKMGSLSAGNKLHIKSPDVTYSCRKIKQRCEVEDRPMILKKSFGLQAGDGSREGRQNTKLLIPNPFVVSKFRKPDGLAFLAIE